MRRQYRAEQVDRRFNDAHYYPNCPKDWSYIDIDGLPACKWCSLPLALYETTTNGDKWTSIIGNLAVMAGVPAFLIVVPSEGGVFTGDTPIRWRRIRPLPADPWLRRPLGDFWAVEGGLRSQHELVCERRVRRS